MRRRQRFRKWVSIFLLVTFIGSILFGVLAGRALAASQGLSVLSYKFYPTRDLVFVHLHNPHVTHFDNIVVNMTIKEGTGQNRTIALGQARLPENLVLAPGGQTSTQVPISGRVVRDIPLLAQFEFTVTGRAVENQQAPQVVTQGTEDGISLDVTRDGDQVPYVMGFIELAPGTNADAQAQVELAILSFLDNRGQLVWSERIAVQGMLTDHDSLMIWQKFEQITPSLVPTIAKVEASFILAANPQLPGRGTQQRR